jgi:hypothetical protein
MSRFIYYYAECYYAECHYTECHYVECHYAEYRYAECRSAVIYDQTIFLQLSLKEADTNKPFTDLLTQNTNLMKPNFCLMLKYILGKLKFQLKVREEVWSIKERNEGRIRIICKDVKSKLVCKTLKNMPFHSLIVSPVCIFCICIVSTVHLSWSSLVDF